MIITLPGALRQTDGTWTKEVELREMTGAEEDIMTDTTRDPKKKDDLRVPFRERHLQILSRCTVRIGNDTRPAGASAKTLPLYFYNAWKKATLNDRNFAWVRLRQESTLDGDTFRFETQCPHCGFIPSVKAKVDLSAQEVKTLPLEMFSDTNSTLFTLPGCGKHVKWFWATGEREEEAEAVIKTPTANMRSKMLSLRLLEIDGEPAKPEDIADLSKKDLHLLQQEMDKFNYGLDLTTHSTCTNSTKLPDGSLKCGKDYTETIPIGDFSFFFPSETLFRLSVTSSC